jgi:hypothetical protein
MLHARTLALGTNTRARYHCGTLWMAVVACSYIFAAGGLANPTPLSPPAGGELWESDHWHHRHSVACGPNSIYLLLSLHGRPVDYSQLENVFPVHPDGMSLAELARVCHDLGLPVEVRRMRSADIHKLPKPAIVHTTLGHREHYLVVVPYSGTDLLVMDPTTARVFTTPHEVVRRVWTGYVVFVARTDPLSKQPLLMLLALVVPSLALLGLRLLRFVARLRQARCGGGAL